MQVNKKFEKDILSFLDTYCKFNFKFRSDKKYSVLNGSLDLCGNDGQFWESFDINIYIDQQKYPFTIPIVQEVSEKIERNEDWHIDKDGFCCLDMEHELQIKANSKINISEFYRKVIYPFFANALFKQKVGAYANGEYKHKEDGVKQYYAEKLQLFDTKIIIKLLEAIVESRIPNRNQPYCLCGENKKFKYCHLRDVEKLKCFSKQRLSADLVVFRKFE